MTKVFVNIGLSLDGYMAPEGMTIENWEKPEYKNWGAKWGELMAWIINQQYIRENLKLGPEGETGPVNDMVRNTTERIGANIMGQANVRARRGLMARGGSVSHSSICSYPREARTLGLAGRDDILLRQRRPGERP